VFRKYQNGVGTAWTFDEYLRLRHATSDVKLEAALTDTTTFSTMPGEQDPPSASIGFVTGGYLEMLNRRVTLGRTLAPGDDAPGTPPAVVVSYLTWARRLGADPSIVGRPIWLNNKPATIVGVADRGFSGSRQSAPDAWAPASAYHTMLGGPALGVGSTTTAAVVGRIGSGISIAQAEAAVSTVAASLGLRGSDGDPVTGVSFSSHDNPINRSEQQAMVLAFAIVSTVICLVLLLACANVSNLLLASATTRAQEMGVRLAIGASLGRIVRQLLTESIALGAIGGAIGLLLMLWAVPILARVVQAPVSLDVAPDARVYLFLGAISVLAGVGAGLAPARHAVRDRFGLALKGSNLQSGASADSSRLRAGLVAVQAAASIVLVVLAALLVRATIQSTRVDVGFEAGRLLTVSPTFARGSYDAAGARAYWDLALERVRALPGVAAATVSEHAPFGPGNRVMSFRRSGGRYTIYLNEIQADYFSTVGLRVLRGRTFTPDEAAGHAAVALISDKVARDFYTGEDPLGQSLERVTGEAGGVVIGVVSNAVTARLRELGSPSIYQPMRSPQSAKMMVRTAGTPEALIPAIRSAMQPLDPRARLAIAPVSEGLRDQLQEPRVLAFLASVLATIAVVLAVVGLYGVTTFVVGQRLTEVGVRMALGATGEDVLRLLIRDSLRPVIVGLGAGVLGALVCTRVFSGVLYGVSAVDPSAFAAAAIILLVAATGAVIVPARRAASSDPSAVLRRF
jgi:putative ABC transport system permease protein